MKAISILGSTGSIGRQSLDIIAAYPEKYQAVALAAYNNDVLLEEQIEFFKPQIAVLFDKKAADRLSCRYRGSATILTGEEGLIEAAAYGKASLVLSAVVGFAGLNPAVAALQAGKDLALANKETLVAAGSLIMDLAERRNCNIFPVDSEHSAVWQCLAGERQKQIKKIILTASGGPFRGFSRDQLKTVTVEECLKHPNWSMGKKITIDSATLINKGLEVMEAKWLFGVDYDQIEVLVHPQSIVHSMVEFVDGAIKAQLGSPDMRLPIQYALTFPDRCISPALPLDYAKLSSLTFSIPDYEVFPGLKLAFEVGRVGGTLPCVFNAANEIAVYAFLSGKISFLDIYSIVNATVKEHVKDAVVSLETLFKADTWAREFATDCVTHHIL